MESPSQHDLAAGHVDQASSSRLAGSPSVLGIALAQTRHEPGPAILESQAVEMAPVLGRQGGHEPGLPARHEIVRGARVQRQEKRVLTIQSSLPDHSISWDADLAGDMTRPGEVTTVVDTAGCDPAARCRAS